MYMSNSEAITEVLNEPTLEQVKEIVEQVKEKVEEVKEKVEEVKEKVEKAKEEIIEKAEQVKEKVEEGKELISEIVDESKKVMEENVNLIKNLDLYKTIEKQVQEIIVDGKIDQNDIPRIIVIMTKSYNEFKQLRLPESDLNKLYKDMFNKILSNCNNLVETKKQKMEKLFESSLQLVLVVPELSNLVEVVKVTNNCLGCLGNIFKK